MPDNAVDDGFHRK